MNFPFFVFLTESIFRRLFKKVVRMFPPVESSMVGEQSRAGDGSRALLEEGEPQAERCRIHQELLLVEPLFSTPRIQLSKQACCLGVERLLNNI